MASETPVKDAKSEQEASNHYRHIGDEIRRFIESLPESLEETQM